MSTAAFRLFVSLLWAGCLIGAQLKESRRAPANAVVTYYDAIQPVLQKHCAGCHTAGGIGPMPLETYADVKPWISAVGESVKSRRMPPWFAESNYGEFANDPRLSGQDIETVEKWVSSGAPAGRPLPIVKPSKKTAPAASSEEVSADLVLTAPRRVSIPANARTSWQYIIFPLPFTYDRWIRGAEIRPSNPNAVRDAVLYVRTSQSQWLRQLTQGEFYVPPDGASVPRTAGDEILAVYAPGSMWTVCPESMGRKVPAGSDLILEIQYVGKEAPVSDQPEVALVMSGEQPKKRILTVPVVRDHLRFPPDAQTYKASAVATLTADAELVGMGARMPSFGSGFEVEVSEPNGQPARVLKVTAYKWNLLSSYFLKKPRAMPAGTVLRYTGFFERSAAGAPAAVQSADDNGKLTGFVDLAVDPGADVSKIVAP